MPLRGSWLALLLLSATFLIPALGQGLLISALTLAMGSYWVI